MAKKDNDKKLLDNWVPPANSGVAIGCLATTYTFQSDFFEEECLTRFLSIESKPDEDGPVYLIEREEKLNNISCAAVWVDQAWAKQKRNLRWDLVPIRLSKGILHSKISILQWANCVRVIVGSANLTIDAYRKNQEIFAVIDLNAENSGERTTATSFVQHLLNLINADKFINETVSSKHRSFLDGVLKFIAALPDEERQLRKKGYLSFPIIIEPSGISFSEQVSKIWNENVSNTPPDECYLTSPFFDPPGEKNFPASRLWEMLKKKGAASIDIYTTGEFDADGNPYRIHAPESINNVTPQGRTEVHTYWHILSTQDEDKNNRPLHLKSYWFENRDGWRLLVFGSSNFTVKGWGLSSSCNYEANIAYLTNEYSYKEQFNEAIKTFIDSKAIDVDNIKWQPLPNEDEASGLSEAPLPPFFQSATLIKDKELYIEIRFSSTKPSNPFEIRDEEGKKIFLTYQQWLDEGSQQLYRIPIAITNIPTYFLVYIEGIDQPACLVINITDQQCLPPPDELRNLPLDILAQIITSAAPLHQVLKRYISSISNKKTDDRELINPHDRVDTSTYLLQKTRKYSFAINMIRSRLEQPCATLATIEWRLYGPVGLGALVDAMEKEANGNINEAIFFLTELWTQLGKVKPINAEGILSPEIIKEKLNQFRNDLAERIKQLWRVSDIASIQNYSRKVLENSFS
jgi:HKD family nuclease